jgi:multidrug efflux pump subunit AcrA (membrane-fusion protein)
VAAHRRIGRWVAVAGLVGAAVLVVLFLANRGDEPRYQTVKAERGSLPSS